MARAQTVKANKDYPEDGIKKGETYYKWRSGFRGPVRRSKTPPRPSDLTSAKTGRIDDAIEDAQKTIDAAASPEDVTAAVESVAEVAREVADEYQEALDAWPSGNSQIEERKDNVESYAGDLESFSADSGTFEDIDGEGFEESEAYDHAKDEWLDGRDQGEDARSAEGFVAGVDEYDSAERHWKEDRDERRDAALEDVRQEALDAIEQTTW